MTTIAIVVAVAAVVAWTACLGGIVYGIYRINKKIMEE